MRALGQQGIIRILPVLVVISLVGLISFIILGITVPTEDKSLSALFAKPPAKAADLLPANAKFVPGEIIVKYKTGDNPDDLTAAVQRRSSLSKQPGGSIQIAFEDAASRLKGEDTPETTLSKLQQVEQKVGFKNRKKLIDQRLMTKAAGTDLDNLYVVQTSTQDIKQLLNSYQSLPNVEYVQPNFLAKVAKVPNDPFYSSQWNLAKISAPSAWDVTIGNSTTIVAVVDTGIQYDHPDLPTARLINGWDFINNDADSTDDEGHGTFVTGIIGAVTNNGVGVAGINWQTQIMGVKVMDSTGTGTDQTIVQGITYAVDHGAKVINLSLGSTVGCDQTPDIQSAVDYANSRGVTVVAAAGNDNIDASNSFPGSCNGVIDVAATDQNDAKASYSNFGTRIDIAAPGGANCGNVSCDIASTLTGSQYAIGAGTSFASPVVVGEASLLLAVNPNLTPAQIKTLIQTNSDPIADQTISGKRVNLDKAVLAAASATPPPSPSILPTLSPSPSPSGSFGLTIIPSSVNVSVLAGSSTSALTIISTRSTQFALLGSPTSFGPGINWSVSSGGIGVGSSVPVSIQVNSNVPPGTYSGTGVLRNDQNQQQTFPVSVTVTSLNISPSPSVSLLPSPTPISSANPPCPKYFIGDVLCHNTVDIFDYSTLVSRFNQSVPTCTEGDFNCNSIIDILDYSTLVSHFNQ